MKRKSHRHVVHHHKKARSSSNEAYLVLVRSWVLVVMFAIMLGVGAIAGGFLNNEFLQSNPQVAGASTSR